MDSYDAAMTRIIAWGQYVFPSKVFQPPGNTLRLIDVAYGYGYDGVELDVQLTKDDVLVLMHDNTIDRTTHGSGPVNQLTADELRHVCLKDPWHGPACYVETLEAALKHNGDRGLVMIDMHHAVPRTISAVRRAVDRSSFDTRQLLLLTYTAEGGKLYKETFPDATVLLKAPHNKMPPELTPEFARLAIGLDGVLVPVANFPEARRSFRERTRELGLKLAVYMHESDVAALADIFESGVDFVTSFAPQTFGPARERYRDR